jgi:hypothetical protein
MVRAVLRDPHSWYGIFYKDHASMAAPCHKYILGGPFRLMPFDYLPRFRADHSRMKKLFASMSSGQNDR